MSGQGVGLCGHTVCSSPAYSIFPVKSSQNLDFLMYFSMLLKSSDLLPLLMQTQQKGTVPLVDSVTERQQSSELPPKPLAFARKSELSLMGNTPIIVPYGLHPPLDKRQRGSRFLLLQTFQN